MRSVEDLDLHFEVDSILADCSAWKRNQTAVSAVVGGMAHWDCEIALKEVRTDQSRAQKRDLAHAYQVAPYQRIDEEVACDTRIKDIY